MPIMNIIVLLILFDDHIGITIIEFSMELRVLSDWFKLFDPINF
jgi:hypothetical protein